MEFKVKSKKLRMTLTDGTVHEFRCPSLAEQEELVADLESAKPQDAIKVYCRFFEGLGLPESATKQLDVDDFEEFIGFVLNPKKKSVI